MDSSGSIVHTLWSRIPLLRYFKTAPGITNHINLSVLRHLWLKVLLLIDVLVGLWLAGTYIYVFHALSNGGTVGEPDIMIARVELWLSIGVTCWFLWQVPYWVIRLLRGPQVLDPTQTGSEGSQEKGK